MHPLLRFFWVCLLLLALRGRNLLCFLVRLTLSLRNAGAAVESLRAQLDEEQCRDVEAVVGLTRRKYDAAKDAEVQRSVEAALAQQEARQGVLLSLSPSASHSECEAPLREIASSSSRWSAS